MYSRMLCDLCVLCVSLETSLHSRDRGGADIEVNV